MTERGKITQNKIKPKREILSKAEVVKMKNNEETRETRMVKEERTFKWIVFYRVPKVARAYLKL